MSGTKKLFATRDFNDAGTGRSFEAGKPIEGATEGELANYEAAGLVGDKPAETAVKNDGGKAA